MTRLKQFLKAAFSPGVWSATWGTVAIVGLLLTLFLDAKASMLLRFGFGIVFLSVYLNVVLAYGAYRFFDSSGVTQRITVRRQVAPVGLSTEADIVVLDNPGFLREHMLLTLYDDASGAEQPLAILQVTRSADEEAQACAFPAGSSMEDLGKRFDAKNRTSLYATLIVRDIDLARHLETIAKKRAAQLEAIPHQEAPQQLNAGIQ